MITLNVPLAVALIARAVERKGAEHVQRICKYVEGEHGPNPQEGCIVGCVMTSIVGIDALVQACEPGTGVNGNILSVVDGIFTDQLGVSFTPGALHLLNRAQEAQDGRGDWSMGDPLPWGEVLDVVKEQEGHAAFLDTLDALARVQV